MNGEVCCILQVCCPPEERAAALAREMKKDHVLEALSADVAAGISEESLASIRKEVAEYLFKHFDLVPAGTVRGLVQSIADVAVKAHEAKKAKP